MIHVISAVPSLATVPEHPDRNLLLAVYAVGLLALLTLVVAQWKWERFVEAYRNRKKEHE